MSKLLNTLRRQAGVRTLLSAINSNPKVAKNSKLGVFTAILHLAPGNMSGHEVCHKRSPGCSASCLHFAGNPAYQNTKNTSRIAKTRLFFRDKRLFMNILALEIFEHSANCRRHGVVASVRLNGTSDIVWEKKSFELFDEVKAIVQNDATNIIDMFPDIVFYDYTAIPHREKKSNYNLTFSLKEQNVNDAVAAIKRGLNVAVVFEKRPAEFLGLPVIDGDEHDYRPADPSGVIVGLKAKGRLAREDRTGFVYRVIGDLVRDKNMLAVQQPAALGV